MEENQVNELQWNPNDHDMPYSHQPAQPQADAFFHPLDCGPTLQIGYVPLSNIEVTAASLPFMRKIK